ncbi:MAG: SPOR domain-containing protein, partial [Burkholderiaceae bacterium]|nr:SPOR domain-containing protein [Burkholderiaceae bacterium]
MGWFSRKENAPAGRGRPMISSEAQAAELRARARRRLVGAIVLVLMAVVVLPMVLNPEPDRVAEDVPIRLPDPVQIAAPMAVAPSVVQTDVQPPPGVDLDVAGVPPPPPLS